MAKIDLQQNKQASSGSKPLTEKLGNLLNKDIQFGTRSLSNGFKEQFYSDLHVLVSSGLDLRSALEVLTEESESKTEHAVLLKVKAGIFSGRSFADVLNEVSGFSEYEVYSIRIGEETGSLSDVLGNLSDDFQQRIKLKRELITAFSYPIMVSLVAFGAVAFMLTFVVPLFKDLFDRMGQELPWLTRKVVSLSSAFVDYWWIVAVLVIIGLAALILAQRNPRVKTRFQYLLLRIPWFGGVLKESKLARFSGSMAFLLESNVNLLRSLRLSADMTQFSPISEAVKEIEDGLVKGDSLKTLLGRHNMFDSRFVALIHVGEEVNQLGEVFRHLSVQNGEQVQRKTKLLSTFIEPIMIGFLGILVGVILISMYLPLFEMNASFN